VEEVKERKSSGRIHLNVNWKNVDFNGTALVVACEGKPRLPLSPSSLPILTLMSTRRIQIDGLPFFIVPVAMAAPPVFVRCCHAADGFQGYG